MGRDHILKRTVHGGLLLSALAAFGGSPVRAQNPPVPVEVVTQADTALPDSASSAFPTVTPGGAFLRAVLLPGWGHASIGSHTRAGFYFTLESVTAYGILRTGKRLSEASSRADFREVAIRAELSAQGVTDVDEIDTALDADAALEDLRSLTEARQQQREDLIAFGLFLLFLSGADAFVSAHLQDFPEPLTVEGGPGPHGRFELGLRLRLPN